MKRKTRRQKKLVNTLLALTLAAGLALPSSASAATYTAKDWADFNTNIVPKLQTGDTVTFAQGAYITTGGTQIDLSGKTISIDGNGAVIDGASITGSILYTHGDLGYISNITMANGNIFGSGGAVGVYGNLTGGITNSVFTNNMSTSSGGAVFVWDNLTGGITNSVFTNNDSFSGGALYVMGNLIGDITNSVFINNTASQLGGAVYANFLIGGITNSVFINNSANDMGGAVFVGGNLTGGITNSVFTNNDSFSGGALGVGSLTGNITNSVFANNSASMGGAIYISSDGATIDNNAGQSTLFHGNTANSTPNSIYFQLTSSGTLDVTGAGSLYMYDPISTSTIFGDLTVNKTNSGTWVLGGDNSDVKNTTSWKITEGTLVLTDDSPMTGSANIYGADFTLASGATLLIAPNALGSADINTTTSTTLNGAVGVGSDERYRAYINPSTFSTTLLTTNNLTNNSTLLGTSGTFGLGQYDYTYDGLAWNGNNLTYSVTSAALSPERNGIYAANAPLRATLANGTTPSVFGHIDDILSKFGRTPLASKVRYMATPQEQEDKKQLDVWGTLLNNNSRMDSRGYNAGSSVNTPGLIIGTDMKLGERSFIGGAISATWPDYEQGRVDADGKDIRLAIYGGSKLTSGWQLGYIASAGKGNMTHRRRTTGDTSRAKYDISSYTLGLSAAKPIEYQIGKTIKPYLSYEYIKSLSDGYTENSHTGLADITAGGQNNTISRVKLGMSHRKENARGTFLETGLYWQGLFGDKEASVTSFMNTNPGAPVSLTETGMDTSSLGIDLSCGRKIGKTDMSLSYNGVYGAHSRSNTFSVNFTYKF